MQVVRATNIAGLFLLFGTMVPDFVRSSLDQGPAPVPGVLGGQYEPGMALVTKTSPPFG